MTALDRKMWRDLWHLKAQAIAIALVITSGAATFIMFNSTLDSLRESRAWFYADYRFAHVFATLKRAPERVHARIEEIPGVDKVETRVVAPVNVEVEGFGEPISGRVLSLELNGQTTLNLLHLRAGRIPQPGRDDEAVISDAFADAQHLQLGDRLHVIVKGRRMAIRIVGIGLSPEYVYQLRPGSMFPDFQRYAILWMGRDVLASAYDMQGAFNDVVLALRADAHARDVIQRLDAVLDPYGGFGAYERADQLSHKFLSEEFKQLQRSSAIFPVLFLGVAAFLLNVVITRVINTQREQIAALKAFGYRNREIALHYFKLVLVVVLAGIAGGIVAGIWLGQGMSDLYMRTFRLPVLRYTPTPNVLLTAVVTNIACAALGTVFALRNAARLQPAQAMRPEPPTQYRETILERLGMKRFASPATRMILRHIGRRPVKSALTVFGIALACGITMSGRFQEAVISYMVEVQYNRSQRQDLWVMFIDPTSRRVQYELDSIPGVEHVEVARYVPVRLRYGHRAERTGIRGFESGGHIYRLLDADLNPVALPSNGLLLTDYLAQILGVTPGDRVTVEILEGARPTRELVVVGLVKEYLGVSAYMELDALNEFMREGPVVSGAYLAVDHARLGDIFAALQKAPRIASTVLRQNELANFHKTMDETMLFITTIATVFAVIIAFGVVYNSARISLTERARELASLRVLGFTRGEISYILLGELVLLTVAAIPLGFYIGRAICNLFVEILQSELYRVPLIIARDTYAFAALVVIVSVLASGLIVRRRLDRLDLIGVLKTKE
jgi:putative ABC transport system permease protein